ncbi:hypothetical protein ABPG74_019904 [Tetrahymena malaccensis]
MQIKDFNSQIQFKDILYRLAHLLFLQIKYLATGSEDNTCKIWNNNIFGEMIVLKMENGTAKINCFDNIINKNNTNNWMELIKSEKLFHNYMSCEILNNLESFLTKTIIRDTYFVYKQQSIYLQKALEKYLYLLS